MHAPGLTSLLRESRPKLNSIDTSSVFVENPNNMQTVQGRIAEYYVRVWLASTGFTFDESFPRDVNGYHLFQTPAGVVVKEGKKTKCEYDFVALHDGHIYIVQVKSGGLNGISSKLEDYLTYGKIVLGENVEMLLFIPNYAIRHSQIETMEHDHPEMKCMNLGIKKKELRHAVKQYMSAYQQN